MEKMQNWKLCILLCSDCSLTPSQNQKWKLGCSECSSTLQWLQSNAPRIRSGSWAAVSAVQLSSDCSAVQLCSDCSPPRIRSGSWAAVSAVQLCSDCSLSDPPPPESEVKVGLQWVQFNFAVTAVQPPPRTHVVACHLLVNVLWVTGFTHFTSWSGKSHKATNSSWDKSKHFYLDNSESG